jgi:hypothetical protein
MESGKDVPMKNAPPEDNAQCSENVSVPMEGEVTQMKPETLTSVPPHVLLHKQLHIYRNWPIPARVQPTLAEGRFFVFNNKDHVQCAFCLGIIGTWTTDDKLLAEHPRHIPRCPYVIGPLGRNILPRATKETEVQWSVAPLTQEIPNLWSTNTICSGEAKREWQHVLRDEENWMLEQSNQGPDCPNAPATTNPLLAAIYASLNRLNAPITCLQFKSPILNQLLQPQRLRKDVMELGRPDLGNTLSGIARSAFSVQSLASRKPALQERTRGFFQPMNPELPQKTEYLPLQLDTGSIHIGTDLMQPKDPGVQERSPDHIKPQIVLPSTTLQGKPYITVERHIDGTHRLIGTALYIFQVWLQVLNSYLIQHLRKVPPYDQIALIHYYCNLMKLPTERQDSQTNPLNRTQKNEHPTIIDEIYLPRTMTDAEIQADLGSIFQAEAVHHIYFNNRNQRQTIYTNRSNRDPTKDHLELRMNPLQRYDLTSETFEPAIVSPLTQFLNNEHHGGWLEWTNSVLYKPVQIKRR